MIATKPRRPELQRGHPLARGLIGAWPFWERGGSVRDATKTFVGASLSGDMTWATHALGPCLRGGSSGHVPIATFRAGQITDAITVSLWVRSRVSQTHSPISNNNTSGDAATFEIFDVGGLFWGRVRNTSGTNATASGGTWTAGVWYNVVLRYSSAEGALTIWANGVVQGTDSLTGDLFEVTGDPIQVGRRGEEPGAYFYYDGDIADVRIWSRALARHEIQQLHADPWALYRPSPRFIGQAPAPATAKPWLWQRAAHRSGRVA